MRTYERQQIIGIQNRFGISDEKYASLVYVLSKSSRIKRSRVVEIFEEQGLARNVEDISKLDITVYNNITSQLDEERNSKVPLEYHGGLVPGGRSRDRVFNRDLRERLQAESLLA